MLQLITNLIQNTTPPHAQSSDPFWEKSETALLQAPMLYLLPEAPPQEQNFGMVKGLNLRNRAGLFCIKWAHGRKPKHRIMFGQARNADVSLSQPRLAQ